MSTVEEPADARRNVGRASTLLASGTMVSRVLGFVSALVLAQVLGITGAGADTFALANQLPNNIYAIVAGGLLSAVLVPQIVRAGLHPDGGQKYINRLLTLGFVVFLAAAVLATLAAPLLVSLYAHQGGDTGRGLSSEEIALATAFAYWCLPQILFYALYSLLGEVLNARHIFGPFTWAPVINNIVAIAGMAVFMGLFGVDPAHRDAANWTPGMITLLAGSATLGVAAQASFLLFFWRATGFTYRPDFRWRGVGLGSAGKAAAWVFGMILITQIAGVVQTNVASTASGSDASITVLKNAWLIFMLPHSIVAVSVATAYFTRMSGAARDGNLAEVRADLSSSLRAIGLFMVFSAVGLIVIASPFSALFATTFEDAQSMALVLTAFLLGLVPFSILFVVQRTFYSLEDTRTPFFIQLVQVALFVAGALYVASWPSRHIAVGIALVTTVAGLVQVVLATIVLRRRLGGLDGRRMLRQHLVFLLAALPSAAVGVLLLFALGGNRADGFAMANTMTAFVSVIVIGSTMVLVYLLALALLRNDELAALLGPIRSRLSRFRR